MGVSIIIMVHNSYCENKVRKAANSWFYCAARERCPCIKLQTSPLPRMDRKMKTAKTTKLYAAKFN